MEGTVLGKEAVSRPQPSEDAAQCIVIGPVCVFVTLWVCYHNNLKLCASILTKLGL